MSSVNQPQRKSQGARSWRCQEGPPGAQEEPSHSHRLWGGFAPVSMGKNDLVYAAFNKTQGFDSKDLYNH